LKLPQHRHAIFWLALPACSLPLLVGLGARGFGGSAWAALAVGGTSAALAAYGLSRRAARPIERLSLRASELRAREFEGQLASGEERESFAITQALSEACEQLAATRERAATARAEISSLMGAMAEGVLALDAQERVLTMNDSAARMLGLREPLPAGRQWWVDLRFPELEQALRRALAGAAVESFDARPPLGDGSLISVSINPLLSEGRRNGAVVVLTDVTAMRQLEQMRIDFVANVSHELRTPLSIVLGSLETLQDAGSDEAARARFLEIAGRNARRLHAIVTDLLDLSTIESQGGNMPMEPLELERVVRASAAALLAAAEAKRVRLLLEDSLREERFRIMGNSQRLEQVFTNLIENAIKYTPAGGEVRVRAERRGPQVCVEVADSGVGIPREHLHRIFERFYRVDRSRSREMGGTGLGLAIVKHVVKAHDGQVDADSVEGEGSTFRVEFPLLAD
jgi:two-component system phosphate regulon sensor histidine kinase PhoR